MTDLYLPKEDRELLKERVENELDLLKRKEGLDYDEVIEGINSIIDEVFGEIKSYTLELETEKIKKYYDLGFRIDPEEGETLVEFGITEKKNFAIIEGDQMLVSRDLGIVKSTNDILTINRSKEGNFTYKVNGKPLVSKNGIEFIRKYVGALIEKDGKIYYENEDRNTFLLLEEKREGYLIPLRIEELEDKTFFFRLREVT